MDKGTLQDVLSDLRTQLTDVISAMDDADRIPFGDMGKHLDDAASAAQKADRYAETLEKLIDRMEDGE